jgi:hypothetical protein
MTIIPISVITAEAVPLKVGKKNTGFPRIPMRVSAEGRSDKYGAGLVQARNDRYMKDVF